MAIGDEFVPQNGNEEKSVDKKIELKAEAFKNGIDYLERFKEFLDEKKSNYEYYEPDRNHQALFVFEFKSNFHAETKIILLVSLDDYDKEIKNITLRSSYLLKNIIRQKKYYAFCNQMHFDLDNKIRLEWNDEEKAYNLLIFNNFNFSMNFELLYDYVIAGYWDMLWALNKLIEFSKNDEREDDASINFIKRTFGR